MDAEETLQAYRAKRDFERTPEPQGADVPQSEQPIFVVQMHDASNLHYDFRLQMEGVLKCWAVPKGPSTDPSNSRLAVPTEDHPLDYAEFEGVIPEGEYGGGTVMVWDTGPYRNLRGEKPEPRTMAESYAEGKIEVWLVGQKLRGGYALIRTADGIDGRWLMIKMKDDEAYARRKPTSTQDKSVRSGRTLAQIAAHEGA